MATAVGNRIKETTNTEGNVNPFTLLGAQTGFATFSSELNTGDYTYYCVIDGADYEIGIGQLTNSTTLTRDTVLDSTNGGLKLNLSASTKTIFCDIPADHQVFTDKDGNIADASPYRGAIILDDVAALQSETGVSDGEAAFILRGTVDDDELGGLYEYRSASADTLDSPNVIDAVGMGVGRWHKIKNKDHKIQFIPQSAEPAPAAAGQLSYSDGTSSTNGFGVNGKGFYQYTGSSWKIVGSEVLSGANSPVGAVTPDNIGQLYHRTSNDTAWIAVGLTNADWRIISNEEWTQAVNAGSQKLYNMNRVDFESLLTEPGDAAEGMIAYAGTGVTVTNGFGSAGEGFYYHDGVSWLQVGSGAGGASSVGDLDAIAGDTIVANTSGSSAAPAAVTYATLLSDIDTSIGSSWNTYNIQPYDANLTTWAGKTAPAGTVADLENTQTFLSTKTWDKGKIVLKQSTNPLPTAEGEMWWDTDGNFIVVGNGVDQTVIGTVSSSGGLLAANNLSELTNKTTARTNLELGALAQLNTVTGSEIDALAVDTGELAAGAVTYAKIQNVALNNVLLGNDNGAGSTVQELSAGDAKTLLAITRTDVADLNSIFTPASKSEILGTEIENNVAFGGTEGITVPIGTTAQRPANSGGIMRYNTTSGRFEGYETGGVSADWHNFVQEGATTASLDWSSVTELLTPSYDYLNDAVIIYDDDANDVKKTPIAKLAMKVRTETVNHTLELVDGNALVVMNVGTANTVTVPLNSSVAFAVGTTIHIMQQGAGTTTIDEAVGVTLLNNNGSIVYQQDSIAAVTKIATDTWVVYGDIR